MAYSAVCFLVNQLSLWLREERRLLGSLGVEAQLIHNQLEQMKASLRAADAKEENDPNLKEWLRQVREIAYDVEDVLERHIARFSHRTSHGIMGRIKNTYASIKSLKAKHQMASEIKQLKLKVENAHNAFTKNHEVLLASSSSSGAKNIECDDGRDDALLLEEADVVGIEIPKTQLLEWIFPTADYSLKVISVVGMAGLGKSTLVKKVYDDPSVKRNIDNRIWINVSQTCRVENLLLDLITKLLDEMKQAPPSTLQIMTVADMKLFIQDILRHKTYIIVLDDVWSTNVWEALRYAFPRSNTDGRGCIIITTRLNEVAEAACAESGGHVHELQPLLPHKAKELFHKKVFRGEISSPEYLNEFSENILKRCEGLPLAIVVIGGALATKRNDFEAWREFSLGLGPAIQGDISTTARMSKVLSLSYYDLPHYLKSCLLYLSIFPEDHLFKRGSIVRLWMAEGFVEAKHGKSMEEVAEGFLIELFKRSIIQFVERYQDGRPRKFRMHDLVREYLISKATEQNMVLGEGKAEMQWNSKIRRLALDDKFISLTEQNNNYKCLRTLLFFGSDGLGWESKLHKVLRGGCRMLKELDLRGARLDEIPNEVFKLYCLKYLSLRNTNVSIIPKSIGNLRKLETLDLKGCKVAVLPLEIQLLQKLQYLLVHTHEPIHRAVEFNLVKCFKAHFDIGRLLHLKSLYQIDASESMKGVEVVRQIGRLKQLRKLGIRRLKKEDGKELWCSLGNVPYLTALSISSRGEEEIIDLDYYLPPTSLQYLRLLVLRGRLEHVPQWIQYLNALVELRLGWSRIGEDEDPLEYLQGLPNLKVLSLSFAYEGEWLVFKAGGFQRLAELNITDMKKLRGMKMEKGCMPHLQKMVIWRCEAMMELPTGVEHLSDLEEVHLVDMKTEFVDKLFEEKEKDGSKWKLAHVSTINVLDWDYGRWERRQYRINNKAKNLDKLKKLRSNFRIYNNRSTSGWEIQLSSCQELSGPR